VTQREENPNSRITKEEECLLALRPKSERHRLYKKGDEYVGPEIHICQASQEG
jgi:hypothetical protein